MLPVSSARHPMKSGFLHTSQIAGFTFIELIIIAIIISVLIGLSTPQFKKTFAYFELENFVKNIYFLCNYLQSASVSQGKLYRLTLSQETNEFKSFFLGQDGQWIIAKTGTVKSYKIPKEITLEIIPLDKSEVFFYPDGSTDNIEIVFKNHLGYERALVMKGITGGIKIQ